MFVPPQYRPSESGWMIEMVRANPLALLLSNGEPGTPPLATHLPVVADESCPPELTGAILHGHLNRANPHWRSLSEGTAATLVFTGPHAYVSPVHYQAEQAAPTWDYTAVHVHGTVHPLPQGAETLAVVRATVSDFERRFGEGWDQSGSQDYFRQLEPGVGAFRFEVSGADGMFKLSQEKCPEIRDRVCKAFDADGRAGRPETAALMRRLL
ncbi:FMN-binding negative transcriptional regulator [Streptomyces mirabilis]|uniref:FMN-binding negative transcriptional regulator n=1 Tax=Streptomyces mirabilis TaxID=68239 RepID=UPI0036563B46